MSDLREKLYELVASSTTGIAIMELADACILEAHTEACPLCLSMKAQAREFWVACPDAKAIKEGRDE